MIRVRLRVFGPGRGRRHSGDQELNLHSPATVRTLLDHLTGEFRSASPAGAPTGTPDGVTMERLLIIVNGRQVHHLQGLDTPLAEGDVIAIMPPVIGG
jgi:molybdopterin converting factor small subunit